MSNFTFDATQVEPQGEYKPIPDGTYVVWITSSEWKSTRAGTGRYLALTVEVAEGDHKGRNVYENLNLENPNQTAVNIAKATLSAICRAVNVLQLTDSAQLHNKPFKAVIGARQGNDGTLRNNIKKVLWKEPGVKLADDDIPF